MNEEQDLLPSTTADLRQRNTENSQRYAERDFSSGGAEYL